MTIKYICIYIQSFAHSNPFARECCILISFYAACLTLWALGNTNLC